ncbi:leucine-rich receptor-like protein kinase family protein [Striga asiatica]|uniref:Leucine-rich receptor-like protein kinase family protein n=1 Tax=Striga asiatica TaxID=4170 RepID=A0A5A7R142_STRAF|nr:leucine-rich receptor-like protein kinase family protein [Striga asiatica]
MACEGSTCGLWPVARGPIRCGLELNWIILCFILIQLMNIRIDWNLEASNLANWRPGRNRHLRHTTFMACPMAATISDGFVLGQIHQKQEEDENDDTSTIHFVKHQQSTLVDDGDFACSSTGVAGSYGYIAPEYGYMMKITKKSDVYIHDEDHKKE